MNNVMKSGGTQDAVRGEVLERIRKQYGASEEKQREAVKKLGKDEFFKIMVTQIQHQDPLKPYQNEEMAAQMAQFSALEQMVNMNQALDKLSQSQLPLHNLGAANLIGKFVTADSSRMLHTEGKYSDINFDLPADAASVRAVIVNEKGENVREIEAKGLGKGPHKLEWDGRRDNNMVAPSGQYMIQIAALNDKGKPIQVSTQKTQVVHGVAFDGKETVLLTGDVRSPQRLLLKNVSKIVDASEAQKAPGGVQVQGPPGVQIGGLENLIPGAAAAEAPSDAVQGQGGFDPSMIGADERVVEGITPGDSRKYQAVELPQLKQNDKPVEPQALTEREIRELINERPDLSGVNPVAEAMRSGKRPEVQDAGDTMNSLDGINPAARERMARAEVGQDSAAEQNIPSSADGSTAGEWME